jgi:predicted small secreted protein
MAKNGARMRLVFLFVGATQTRSHGQGADPGAGWRCRTFASEQTLSARGRIVHRADFHSRSAHTRRAIMMRKMLAALAMLGVLSSLVAVTGCNTVAGAGQDIERGGQKVQGEAREVQKKM